MRKKIDHTKPQTTLWISRRQSISFTDSSDATSSPSFASMAAPITVNKYQAPLRLYHRTCSKTPFARKTIFVDDTYPEEVKKENKDSLLPIGFWACSSKYAWKKYCEEGHARPRCTCCVYKLECLLPNSLFVVDTIEKWKELISKYSYNATHYMSGTSRIVNWEKLFQRKFHGMSIPDPEKFRDVKIKGFDFDKSFACCWVPGSVVFWKNACLTNPTLCRRDPCQYLKLRQGMSALSNASSDHQPEPPAQAAARELKKKLTDLGISESTAELMLGPFVYRHIHEIVAKFNSLVKDPSAGARWHIDAPHISMSIIIGITADAARKAAAQAAAWKPEAPVKAPAQGRQARGGPRSGKAR